MEVQLPTDISYGAVGGSGWSTRMEIGENQFELRQPRWQEVSATQSLILPQQRGRWTVAHELRDPTGWAELITFHRLAKGRLNGFRFQDWSDYQVTTNNGYLVIDSAGNMRLAKQYQAVDYLTSVPVFVNRLIFKPQPTTVVFSPTGPSVDYTTGIVTGGNVVSTRWSGQFDVPVRFDNDHCELHYRDYNIVDWPGVSIVELPTRI